MNERERNQTAGAAKITGLSIHTIQYPAPGRTVPGSTELGREDGEEVANG